jgi:hypothetical protein
MANYAGAPRLQSVILSGCLAVGLGVALEPLPLCSGVGKRIAEALFLSYEGLAGDILASWDFK